MKTFARFAAGWILLSLGVPAGAVPATQPATQPDSPPRAISPRLAVGVVFRDDNGNGVRDADEPPLAGIRVSDGIAQVVVTDVHGAYRLELDPEHGEFVIVTLPGGYEAVGPFFRRVRRDGDNDRFEADFPLRAAADPTRFRFLVFTDVHIHTNRRRAELVADLLENTAALKPRFAVNAGDIAHGGNEEQYRWYQQAVARSAVCPVYDVPGNHDTGPAYTGVLGPRHYSFQRGGVHVVVIDSSRPQWRWVAADLAHVPVGEKLVVFNHHGLGRLGLGALEPRKDDILAVIHGHGHAWADVEVRGIRHYMAGYLAYFDGFAMAEINDGALTVEYVELGRPLLEDAEARGRRWEEIRRRYRPIPASKQ